MNYTKRLFNRFSTKRLNCAAFLIVLSLSISGFRCNPFGSSGTDSPQVTIQNATVSRDEVTDLPMVTVEYSVKYPSDLYPQTLSSVPSLTCTMEQGQLTQTRTFTGAPVGITGLTAKPQTGQATIEVPENGRFIAGSFFVKCTLASDRTLGISNTVSIEVPKPSAQEEDCAVNCPPSGGQWVLESVTVSPETPTGGYSYNSQGSTAHLDVYNGDKHDFSWTRPPSQIDANGITISINAKCQSQPNNRCASLIGVAGDGFTSNASGNDDLVANAYGENGAVGSGQKNVSFKPNPNSDELTVRVGIMWGAVEFFYKYRRAK